MKATDDDESPRERTLSHEAWPHTKAGLGRKPGLLPETSSLTLEFRFEVILTVISRGFWVSENPALQKTKNKNKQTNKKPKNTGFIRISTSD